MVGKLVGRTVAEIAEAVRSGQATPGDAAREHLEQIEELDPRIGAFVRVRSWSASPGCPSSGCGERPRTSPACRGTPGITPVMTRIPVEAAGWRDRSWRANFWGNARWVPFPGAWNFAQYPGAAVPAGVHPSGMPIGVQLVAPTGGEALLLSVARQLEQLRPWPRHAPLAGVD